MSGLLRLEKVSAGYGDVQVLRGLSLETRQAEVHCLVGRNGAGKTTTLKTIMGLLPLSAGQITLDGQPISNLDAHEVPRLGIGYVPQGRRLFAELTVAENLEIGLMTRRTGSTAREKVLELFPKLKERLKQRSAPCRVVSSKCWPWRVRCVWSRRYFFWTSPWKVSCLQPLPASARRSPRSAMKA